MSRLAEKVRRYESVFRFHLLSASLGIEVSDDGCYEKVRFHENKHLRYEIEQSRGDLGAFECEILVHDCGAEIGEEEGLYVTFPRRTPRSRKRQLRIELFLRDADFRKFRHLADIMIADDRYDLEFTLPFTGLDDIADFPSDDIAYDMAGMRFELRRQ